MEQFSKISDILSEAIFDKNSYSYSMKKATAFSFWKDVCGARFSNFSVPYDIKGQTLYVAVKNPQVLQELMFYKANLLSKLKNYFLPLNISVEDIRFDYKVWNSINKSNVLVGDESLEYYTKAEIDDVELNRFEREEMKKVTNTISNLEFLSDSLKEKYSRNIINSLKVKKLRME